MRRVEERDAPLHDYTENIWGIWNMQSKLKLYGFNNLTKSLSFNIYDVCYAKSPREQRDYIAYIDEQYNSERLTKILFHVTKMIGAHVLNVSKQDYDPQGASVTFLIAESNMIPAGQKSAASAALSYQESLLPSNKDGKINNGSDDRNDKQSCEQKDAYNYCNCDCYGNDELVAHLDKSHITVHTYPEYHPETNIATFRVDIDVATCGEITPLSTLDFLIGSFDSDIITMDYRVRGFTRNVEGKKIFIDHTITSIQDYIDKVTLDKYDAIDINMYQANIFHTKMLIKEIDLQNYLFNSDIYEITPKTRLQISNSLRQEMIEIFSGANIF